jgi:hypothetical protein
MVPSINHFPARWSRRGELTGGCCANIVDGARRARARIRFFTLAPFWRVVKTEFTGFAVLRCTVLVVQGSCSKAHGGPPLHNFERTISKANSALLIANYLTSIKEIDNSLGDHTVLDLLKVLKRKAVGAGPYPHVTMFEAANRILSDLVILYGVKWLLDKDVFPFEQYQVEYGNENKNGFDIRADANGKTLIGEAFNVAPSFFQSKKCSMLRKMDESRADFKIMMFNSDAVRSSYAPKPTNNVSLVVVQVDIGDSYMIPRFVCEPKPASSGSDLDLQH